MAATAADTADLQQLEQKGLHDKALAVVASVKQGKDSQG